VSQEGKAREEYVCKLSSGRFVNRTGIKIGEKGLNLDGVRFFLSSFDFHDFYTTKPIWVVTSRMK
jgi:hypothetical protein